MKRMRFLVGALVMSRLIQGQDFSVPGYVPYDFFVWPPEYEDQLAEEESERSIFRNPYMALQRRLTVGEKIRWFVTFYRRDNKAIAIIFEISDGNWTPVRTRELAQAVEAQGIVEGKPELTSVLPPGFNSVRSAAVNYPSKLYILDVYADPQVIVIDEASTTPIKRIPVERGAWIAMAPDQKSVYVLQPALPPTPIRITVIDTTTDRVTGTFNLTSSASVSQINALAASPDGRRLYVAVSNMNTPENSVVLVVDVATQSVVATIRSTGTDVRSRYEGVWVSPDAGLVYAATQGSIVVIDALTSTVSTTIPLSGVQTLVFQADGTKAYAANFTRIQEIDVATSQLRRFVNLGVVNLANLALDYGGSSVQGWDSMGRVLKRVNVLSMTALPDEKLGGNGAGWITIVP